MMNSTEHRGEQAPPNAPISQRIGPAPWGLLRAERRDDRRAVGRQMITINALFILSSVIAIFGAWEITKGSHFHDLNFLHVRYNNEFAESVEWFVEEQTDNIEQLQTAVAQVRQPSARCVENVGFLRRQFLRLVGSIQALELCAADVALADATLQAIEDYDNGELSRDDLTDVLLNAVGRFWANSYLFEPLVGRTVNLTFSLLIAFIVIKTFAIALLGLWIGRRVTANYVALEEAEKAEKQANERLEVAVKGSSVGLWDWDTKSGKLYWSPRFKEIVGLSDEAFTGDIAEFTERLHPEDRDPILTVLGAHLKDGTPYDVKYRLRRQDGSYVWLHARGQAVFDGAGVAVRMAGSVDDISGSVDLLERVASQKEELRLILDNVPARILYKDDKNRILRLNQRAADSMGLSVEEAEGADCYELFPEMAAKYHADDLEVLQSNEPKLGIIERYTPQNGGHGWVRTDKVPFVNRKTGERHVLASIVDITELKQAETQLAAQAEDLRRSNAELEKFAYVASHDLKAPLRGIDNLATWIEEDLEEASEETRENLHLMRGRIARLEALLDDLLAYSRVGRGKHAVAEVDVTDLVHEIADLQEGANSFELDIAEPLPVFETARAPLRQVLINLIGNAAKHCDKPGVRISVRAEVSDEFFAFEVTDDGPGIEVIHQEKIFEMFQTLRPRDMVEGSGMGLAIVKKLIESVGGHIHVRSDPAQAPGATFRFTWPRVLPG